MTPSTRTPRAGDVLELTRAASVQFLRPIRFRVIRALDWPTYHGWCWLDGYQLDARGDATARRTVYVQPAGIAYVPQPPTPARRTTARRPVARTATPS